MPSARLTPQDMLLLRYADPQAPADGAALDANQLARLLDDAEVHGVMPIVLRKVSGIASLPQDAGVQARLGELRDRATIAAGQSMLLQYHGGRIMRALAEAGVAARIVKGPIFANKLYRHVADRPFTDIDILVAPYDMARANAVIARQGFVLGSDEAESEKLQEFKWLEKENNNLLIELQGNLVHDTGMRRRLSLGFAELAKIDGEEVDTPPALLAIAIVHAAGGHKFHRLQLCVDVLQGVRALSPQQETRLFEAARIAGVELELATVLDVTGRLFGEQRAMQLANRVDPDLATRLARWLITPKTLIDVNARNKWRSRLRRDVFRWVQRLAKARPYPS